MMHRVDTWWPIGSVSLLDTSSSLKYKASLGTYSLSYNPNNADHPDAPEEQDTPSSEGVLAQSTSPSPDAAVTV